MALIKCKECGKEISDKCKTCPNCGYPIAIANNDTIYIKIDSDPSCPGSIVNIHDAFTKNIITSIHSGGVATIKSKKSIEIYFSGLTKIPMYSTTVSPNNGGRYHATWGPGLFTTRIVSCSPVDVIDS